MCSLYLSDRPEAIASGLFCLAYRAPMGTPMLVKSCSAKFSAVACCLSSGSQAEKTTTLFGVRLIIIVEQDTTRRVKLRFGILDDLDFGKCGGLDR